MRLKIATSLSLLSLCLPACQSAPLAKPNPYPLQVWARCSSPSAGMTAVDFYLWNRSSVPLQLPLSSLGAAISPDSDLGIPATDIVCNYKSAKGLQSFRRADQISNRVLSLNPNDAVDVEFNIPEAGGTQLRFSLQDPANVTYETVLPCRY